MNSPVRINVSHQDEQCGIFGCRPAWLQRFANVKIFVLLMCIIVAVQGTYLGYVVGVLTSVERSFHLSSGESGFLFSAYDIGHTMTVLLVGYFGASRHKPRWTATGCMLSAVAMFGLAVPYMIYHADLLEGQAGDEHIRAMQRMQCNSTRKPQLSPDGRPVCGLYQGGSHKAPYAMLIASQLLAGVSAAPFNTLAYIYIDDNVSNRQSPFYLGLLTSMYAFGPALGFGLSAITTSLHVGVGKPETIDSSSPQWIGAWWLGFILCGILYLLFGIPMFWFPKRLPRKRRFVLDQHLNAHEMGELHKGDHKKRKDNRGNVEPFCSKAGRMLKEMGRQIWHVVRNPIYSSMLVGWVFAAYLVGGYGTYLPKYFEQQYAQTQSMADVYSGIITVGAIAFSTACGGYVMTRFNIQPRMATLLLIITWIIIVITYLVGMSLGCPEVGIYREGGGGFRNFTMDCNRDCRCEYVNDLYPVCVAGTTFASPCHGGCAFDATRNQWSGCKCAPNKQMHTPPDFRFCDSGCSNLSIYIAIMFVGLFLGNLFFMTTMVVILRCVTDEYKSIGLSFASAITNIFGFIPSPAIFGAIIDTTCLELQSLCHDDGNCLQYNNEDFRYKFHSANAAFQLVAVLAVGFTYFKMRTFKFPEEMYDDEYESEPPPAKRP